MPKIHSLLFVTFALASCALDEIDESPALIVVNKGGANCPAWGCTTNSAMAGPWAIWNGRTDGAANTAGVRFGKLYLANGLTSRPMVVADQLFACPDAGGGCVTGLALKFARWELFMPDGTTRDMWIRNVRPRENTNVAFWVGPPDPVATYELRLGAVNGDPVCQEVPDRESGEGPSHKWYNQFESLFFTGDMYDFNDHSVVNQQTAPARVANTFIIACPGSVLAKLHFNRHTDAGATHMMTTSVPQRRTMFLLYASDQPGNGSEFTKTGTPLIWQNIYGWNDPSFVATASKFESRWTNLRAKCMDKHRLGNQYLNGIYAEFPKGGLPACNANVGHVDFQDAYMISMIP